MGAVAAYEQAAVYQSPQGSSPAPIRSERGPTLLIKTVSAVSVASRACWTALRSTAGLANTADVDTCMFLRNGTLHSSASAEMPVPAARTADRNGDIPAFLRAFEHVTELNRTEMSDLLGISRPAYYGYLSGTLPRERQLKRITALKQLANAMRAGYFTQPADKASVLAWLDAFLMQADRAALDAALKQGRTTFAVDPNKPDKLLRTNPDGSTETGRFIDGHFAPDETDR